MNDQTEPKTARTKRTAAEWIDFLAGQKSPDMLTWVAGVRAIRLAYGLDEHEAAALIRQKQRAA